MRPYSRIALSSCATAKRNARVVIQALNWIWPEKTADTTVSPVGSWTRP